jgi:DNA-binding XRE family transcriptional regulator
MTTFANQLKSEIAPIAKKEARLRTQQLKKASAQHRSDIAALKRNIAALEVTVKKLSKSQHKPVLKIEEELTTALRFRAGGFATLRKKYDLSAEQMGKLIGVSAQSVYHWESEKSCPRASQLPAIAAVHKLTKKQAWSKLGIFAHLGIPLLIEQIIPSDFFVTRGLGECHRAKRNLGKHDQQNYAQLAHQINRMIQSLRLHFNPLKVGLIHQRVTFDRP